MAQLDDQRISLEAFAELIQITSFFAIVFERPGKLDQHGAQLVLFQQRIDSFANHSLVVCGCFAARVREHFVELGSKDEIRIMGYPAQPRSGRLGRGRMIETAVYLGRVEIFCHQRQSVDLRAGAFGIDTATPISIRPTGGTNMNISANAHEDEVGTIRVSEWVKDSILFGFSLVE